ncbi:MAG TPA: serine/threonine-protein kinase [Kofleriaceae bacterium]
MNAPKVEKHIGQYKILRTLGAGGMGTVYLGEHLLLGRRAAIKTLLPSLSSHREIVDRFFNEARAISAISDPGVVQVFDFGYHVDGTAFIVMEFLEGESLSARLDRMKKLRLVDALRLGRQLSSSLAAAHERGIVHRDLKPGNVFVIRDPEVPGGERTKILDFGICKLGDPDCVATTTQTGTMLGTPVYMSPEQCRGAGRADHRSDIYSFGCVLFHMITGRPPFDCESVGDYIAAHLKEAPATASVIAPELPPSIDALMTLCLAKEPENRFQSMTELQQAIEQVLAHLSDGGSTAVNVPKQLQTVPLGEGFKSSYDVNLGNQMRTVDQTPTPPVHSWFVDSLLPISISANYEVEKPGLGWGKRFALMLALLVGVAGGLLGTSYALEAEAANDTPPPSAPEIQSLEEAAPAYAQTATETMPTEPVVAVDEAVVEPVAVAPPPPAPAKKKIEAARSQRARVVKPARPRRVVREPEQPQQPQEPEDLYDTR